MSGAVQIFGKYFNEGELDTLMKENKIPYIEWLEGTGSKKLMIGRSLGP